jgi:glyoxylase-like metal-dependent hydrolase (beta-lactamase superfamily II)
MPVAIHVLTTGYAHDRVASTVTLLTEDDTVAVVDPGMVADRRLVLGPLAKLGIEPQEVTDVVFSHHHPDHTLNAALFPEARFHDHMAVYRDDIWEDRDADGHEHPPS